MSDKIWVPQPASKLYGGETYRDRLVDRFGEGTVQRAELSVALDIMMITQMITPNEFIEVITKKLERIDRLRRERANLDVDKG